MFSSRAMTVHSPRGGSGSSGGGKQRGGARGRPTQAATSFIPAARLIPRAAQTVGGGEYFLPTLASALQARDAERLNDIIRHARSDRICHNGRRKRRKSRRAFRKLSPLADFSPGRAPPLRAYLLLTSRWFSLMRPGPYDSRAGLTSTPAVPQLIAPPAGSLSGRTSELINR